MKTLPSINDQAEDAEAKPPQRTPSMHDYFRVFRYAKRWDFCIYAIASFASIAAGVTLPLMTVIMGQLVGQFTDYFQDSSTISPEVFKEILNKQVLYMMALFFGRWGLNTINKFCFRMIGIRLSSAIRLHYLRSLFAQSIHVIDSMPTGAPATAITTTSNTLQVGISERLGTFLEFNGTIWSALIIAFIWSWDLTLVTSSLILYMGVVLSALLPRVVKLQTAIVKADAEGTAIASEALQNIRLVMSCGAQSRIFSRYEKWVTQALEEGRKMAPVLGLQLGLVVGSCHTHISRRDTNDTVLRYLWDFWPGLLVRHQAIPVWRDRQCRSYLYRTDVGYDDSDLYRAHIHAPYSC